MHNTTSPNILLIGDIMLDEYIFGTCSRISPEAPVPVVEVKNQEYTLGGAGNVLKNLLAFNCNVQIISIIGNDSASNLVLQQLQQLNINSSGLLVDETRNTSVKTRVLAVNHQLLRIDRESTHPISTMQEQVLLQKIEAILHQYQIVLFSDYAKGLLTPNFMQKVITACNKKNIKTLVDPKGTDFEKYNGIHLVKPNKKEAIAATGINIINDETLLQACKKIQEITNCNAVVITLSEKGIAYYTNNTLSISKTKPLQVIDVTGAGDTVLAAIGWALATENSLENACNFANKAASVVVSKVGSATTTFNEIDEHFSNK